MMFRIPLVTKLAGAGIAGLVLAGGIATQVPAVAGTVLTAASPATPSPAPGHRVGIRARAVVIRSEAAVLKITPRQLRQDARSGISVEQLAAKAGLDKAQFTAAVVANLKPRLARLVKSGRLTQGQADAILKRVQNGWLPLWTLHPRSGQTSSS